MAPMLLLGVIGVKTSRVATAGSLRVGVIWNCATQQLEIYKNLTVHVATAVLAWLCTETFKPPSSGGKLDAWSTVHDWRGISDRYLNS
jgi:hypothetical protein